MSVFICREIRLVLSMFTITFTIFQWLSVIYMYVMAVSYIVAVSYVVTVSYIVAVSYVVTISYIVAVSYVVTVSYIVAVSYVVTISYIVAVSYVVTASYVVAVSYIHVHVCYGCQLHCGCRLCYDSAILWLLVMLLLSIKL